MALHGCAGRFRDGERRSAERLVAQNYLVLFVDSFAPRGITQTCLADAKIVDRVSDALGALNYLAAQPFVVLTGLQS